MKEIRNAYKMADDKFQRKTILREVPKWEYNIKMHLMVPVCKCAEWIQVAQDVIQWRTLVDTNETSSPT